MIHTFKFRDLHINFIGTIRKGAPLKITIEYMCLASSNKLIDTMFFEKKKHLHGLKVKQMPYLRTKIIISTNNNASAVFCQSAYREVVDCIN
jgi:hypothetical protein